jgi:hypothetical protein
LSSPQLDDVEAVEGTTTPTALHLALAEGLGPVGDRYGQAFELPVDLPDSLIAAKRCTYVETHASLRGDV